MFGSRHCENGDVNSSNVVTVDLISPRRSDSDCYFAGVFKNGGLGRFDLGRESVLLHDQAVYTAERDTALQRSLQG